MNLKIRLFFFTVIFLLSQSLSIQSMKRIRPDFLETEQQATRPAKKKKIIEEKPLKCPHPGCKQSFELQDVLEYHMRIHNRPKLKCPDCSYTYTLPSELTRHQKRVHAKKFKCTECNKTFGTSFNLKQHIRIHTGEKPYACPEPGCNKKFSTPNLAKSHAKIHDPSQYLSCPHCDKSYIHTTSLVSHIRKKHSADNNIQKKHSSNPSEKPLTEIDPNQKEQNKNVAKKRKAQKQIFQCPYCYKTFTYGSELVAHTRSHTGEKPFKCKHCKQRFAQPSLLQRHIKKYHSKINVTPPYSENYDERASSIKNIYSPSKEKLEQDLLEWIER